MTVYVVTTEYDGIDLWLTASKRWVVSVEDALVFDSEEQAREYCRGWLHNYTVEPINTTY